MPFIKLPELADHMLIPGFVGKFIHTPSLTLAYWKVTAGSTLPPHGHLHEQVTHVLEGQFELTLERECRLLVVGDIAVIGPHQLHSGRAITDCYLLDVFSPVREDYRAAVENFQ